MIQARVSILARQRARAANPQSPRRRCGALGEVLTVYDEQHAVTYVRMLDAQAEAADWREVSRIVLDIDPEREPDRAGVRQSPGARKVGRPHWVWQLLCRGWPSRDQDRWLTSSDIFCTIASPSVRHAEVVQRDRLTQRARRQRILAIRRGLIDLDVEDEAISLRAGGLHTGPSLALHWRV